MTFAPYAEHDASEFGVTISKLYGGPRFALDRAEGSGGEGRRRYIRTVRATPWSWVGTDGTSRVWEVEAGLFGFDIPTVGASIYQPLRLPGFQYDADTEPTTFGTGGVRFLSNAGLLFGIHRVFDSLYGAFLQPVEENPLSSMGPSEAYSYAGQDPASSDSGDWWVALTLGGGDHQFEQPTIEPVMTCPAGSDSVGCRCNEENADTDLECEALEASCGTNPDTQFYCLRRWGLFSCRDGVCSSKYVASEIDAIEDYEEP